MADPKKPKAPTAKASKTAAVQPTTAKAKPAKATPAKAAASKAAAAPKTSPAPVARVQLRVGDPAPSFSATITDGSTLHSKDLLGKPVVVYFYPRDDTPGCTKEACGFRDAHADLRKAGAVVLGVSADPVKSHVKFTEKYQLPFALVSDSGASVAQAFGAWGEKVFMGRRYLGMHRMTFLIGADGKVARIWDTVKPETHAAEVLAAVRSS
ncbi:MAG: thioredoxin-dependent thiol peroxidase [Verrucomicrobia bacterium]|nr:thioredoxin-dependent thiol peroxidase [Verrucomicrobiota bacterium]